MDYIYGSLNEDVEQVEYYGVNTDTANTTIKQEDRTIKVDVKKVPNTLTITNGNNEIVYDGSSSQSINIDSGSDYIAGDGITIRDNTISIDGDVVALKSDIPEIPTVDQSYDSTSENAQSGKALEEAISTKQDTLVSGTNIKTINNESILGEGNISVGGGTTLNKYTFDGFSQSSSGFWTKVKNILCGAKGSVFGWYGVDVALNDGGGSIQTYIPVNEIRRTTQDLSSINAIFQGFNQTSGQVFGFLYIILTNGQTSSTFYGKAYKASDGTEIAINSISGARSRTYIEYYNDTQLH